MHLLDRLMTRRRQQIRFFQLSAQVRHRLKIACQELSEAEERIAAQMELPRPPRLMMVDEEEAVIITPKDRTDLSRS